MKDRKFASIMPSEIDYNKCFDISIANNRSLFSNRNIFIRTKDDRIVQLSTLKLLKEDELERLFQIWNCQVKENLNLTNQELLNLTELAFNKQVNNEAFRGICFSKSGINYKFLEYSSEDKTGILLRELDEKLLLIISFPKYGRVLWEVKGEYSKDTPGITQCKEAYKALSTSNRKFTMNQELQ